MCHSVHLVNLWEPGHSHPACLSCLRSPLPTQTPFCGPKGEARARALWVSGAPWDLDSIPDNWILAGWEELLRDLSSYPSSPNPHVLLGKSSPLCKHHVPHLSLGGSLGTLITVGHDRVQGLCRAWSAWATLALKALSCLCSRRQNTSLALNMKRQGDAPSSVLGTGYLAKLVTEYERKGSRGNKDRAHLPYIPFDGTSEPSVNGVWTDATRAAQESRL